MLGVVEVTDAKGVTTKLVKLRNPWGVEKYKGAWCDSCGEWTAETEEQAGVMKSDDGVFFMPIDLYQKYVEFSVRNFYDENIKRSSHLVLGDVSNVPGVTPWCGKRCTRH